MATALALPAVNLVKSGALTLDQCATVEFLAIGSHAVRRSGARARERVLVIGAGPIGLGTALFAAIENAIVTVMDLDSSRLATAGSIVGASTILAGEAAMEAAHSLTDGEGFDVVFDATGNARSIEAGFDFVAHGGRYVMISVVKDRISFSDPDFHRKEMTLLGSRNATATEFEHVASSIGQGRVPVDRLVTHRTGLADAARNLPLWATQKTGLIKALVELD
jgi:threonine dehydrogenase-like Zn-dependent dehydrogenase